MNIGIKILESDQTIAKKILNALRPELSKVFNKAISKIESEIQKALVSALKQEPEYGQLISGILRTEFGIADTGNVEVIVQRLAETTRVRVSPVSVIGNSLKGGIIIEAIESIVNKKKEEVLTGIGVSPGVSIGICNIKESVGLNFRNYKINSSEINCAKDL